MSKNFFKDLIVLDLANNHFGNVSHAKKIITQFAKFKTHAYSNIAGIIILEPVQVPNLKSYPIRSFIVLGSTLIAIIIGIIGVLLLDIYKRVNWKEVLYEKPISNT